MADFPRRTPFGLSPERPPMAGLAPVGGGQVPGSLGLDVNPEAHGEATLGSPAARRPARGDAASPPFTVGDETYRVRHESAVWSAEAYEVPVRTEDAPEILARAIAEHHERPELVHVLEMAAAQLSGLHPEGHMVVVRLRPWARSATSISRPAPPAPSSARASAPWQPPVEEPIMSSPLAAAQAATLKQAAVTGAPFCEECAKAAAAAAAAGAPA